jgi:hypothetical protein
MGVFICFTCIHSPSSTATFFTAELRRGMSRNPLGGWACAALASASAEQRQCKLIVRSITAGAGSNICPRQQEIVCPSDKHDAVSGQDAPYSSSTHSNIAARVHTATCKAHSSALAHPLVLTVWQVLPHRVLAAPSK